MNSEVIKQTVLRLLARRDHSRYELTQKLKARYGNVEAIESTINELEKENLLSEDRYIEQIIHSKQQRGYGPIYIRSYLKEKGITADKISDWLDFDDMSWCIAARAIHAKRFGEQPQDAKMRAKQIRFMQNRGFTREQINQALR